MTEEKGLDPEVADRIGEYVKLKGLFRPVLSCGTSPYSR